MQNTNSPYVANIVALQNVISNTSGLDVNTQLSNAVASLQTMINTTTHTVYTDFLGAFTTGNSIGVLSPLDLCNGASASAPASSNSIGSATGAFVTADTAVTIGTSGQAILTINTAGNTLVNDITRVASEFRVSSMTLVADSIYTSSMNVGNTCYAQQFVQLSDSNAKSNISTIFGVNLDSVGTYKFSYENPEEEEIGLLAQELEGLYPECVLTEGSGSSQLKYVKYSAVTALLLAEVRDLKRRVASLEDATY
jgi:hypothetical protein